jgi:hypothetical protein
MTLKQLTDYLKSKGIEETDEVDFITLWGCEDLQKAKVSRYTEEADDQHPSYSHFSIGEVL